MVHKKHRYRNQWLEKHFQPIYFWRTHSDPETNLKIHVYCQVRAAGTIKQKQLRSKYTRLSQKYYTALKSVKSFNTTKKGPITQNSDPGCQGASGRQNQLVQKSFSLFKMGSIHQRLKDTKLRTGNANFYQRVSGHLAFRQELRMLTFLKKSFF